MIDVTNAWGLIRLNYIHCSDQRCQRTSIVCTRISQLGCTKSVIYYYVTSDFGGFQRIPRRR